MSKNNENNLSDLLDKFRSGKITPDEFRRLKKDICNIADTELKRLLEIEWNKYDTDNPLPEKKKEVLFKTIHHNKAKEKRHYIIGRYWIQIAATVLLVITTGLTIHTLTLKNDLNQLATQNVTISSGDYGKSLVTLPDGTIVQLNAKSYLTYSQNFGHNDREVTLNGEGFFDVKKIPGNSLLYIRAIWISTYWALNSMYTHMKTKTSLKWHWWMET